MTPQPAIRTPLVRVAEDRDKWRERAAQAEALLREWDEYGLKQIQATEQNLYERTKRFLSAGDKP